MSTSTATTCYRHPKRETGVSCSACGNPICPDCMTPTPVGMRCPECARQKTPVRTMANVQGVPVVARAIIAICVLAFVGELVTRNAGADSVLVRGGLAAQYVNEGEWWRIVTSGFLHDDRIPWGLLHIGFNMYFLWYLGQLLEPTLGRVRFTVAFFVCLLGGSLGALWLSPNSLTVGASGAVFGLIAVALMDLLKRGIPPFQTQLGTLLIINLVITFGFAGRISVGAHLGGLAAGAIVGFLFFYVERSRRSLLTPAFAGCVALGVAFAVAGIAIS